MASASEGKIASFAKGVRMTQLLDLIIRTTPYWDVERRFRRV